MSLHLTPAMLERAYNYLRVTPPFDRMKLPDADHVEFVVTASPGYMGMWSVDAGQQRITISSERVGQTDTLMSVMAHEMIHAHQHETRTDSSRSEHNAAFRKMATKVCVLHGWDERAFL